jgi:nitric oxide dioxygenase
VNPDQIALVQHSFVKVAPMAETVAELFYARLFELDPGLKPLFRHGDMRQQGRMLMKMLTITVQGLSSLDTIVPAVQALGRRHSGYGVQPRDYETVGAALIWTLEQGLGAEFTPDVRGAWTAAYGLLSGVMLEAQLETLLAA